MTGTGLENPEPRPVSGTFSPPSRSTFPHNCQCCSLDSLLLTTDAVGGGVGAFRVGGHVPGRLRGLHIPMADQAAGKTEAGGRGQGFLGSDMHFVPLLRVQCKTGGEWEGKLGVNTAGLL